MPLVSGPICAPSASYADIRTRGFVARHSNSEWILIHGVRRKLNTPDTESRAVLHNV
jgi:hypothetical protein